MVPTCPKGNLEKSASLHPVDQSSLTVFLVLISLLHSLPFNTVDFMRCAKFFCLFIAKDLLHFSQSCNVLTQSIPTYIVIWSTQQVAVQIWIPRQAVTFLRMTLKSNIRSTFTTGIWQINNPKCKEHERRHSCRTLNNTSKLILIFG